MESNIDSQVNTRSVRQNRSLAQQDNVIIQKLILDEFEQRSLMSSLEVTYDAVREPHVDEEDKSGLQHTTNRIVERSHGLQFRHKPGVDNSKQEGWELVMKSKNRKGVKNRNETVQDNQCFDYNSERLMAIQDERYNEEMVRALRESKRHLELEKEFQETLTKSYEEEKAKLLTMLSVQDFDFNILADQMNKVLPEKSAVTYKATSWKDISALILAIIELFDHDYTIINAIPIQNHIRSFGQLCLNVGSCAKYEKDFHWKNTTSTFNIASINDYLVNIDIRGDGNCMWSSISHYLTGDYTIMESLRLLTAYALTVHSETFSDILTRQASKFSYNALTLEQLLKTSVTLQSWGDEFHLIALSLALKRPIYIYGSMIDIPESSVMGYEQFRLCYEIESFPNHFKFIGDANDANNDPILLHYDGHSHYSCVLKTFKSVRPLVPFMQIIDALYNGGIEVTQTGEKCVTHCINGDKNENNSIASSGQAEKLIDIDSDMTVSTVAAESRENKSDYLTDDDDDERDEIATLKKDLSDKTRLLQQYESFFKGVKAMLDNDKFNMRQLQSYVEKLENSRK